MFSSALPLRLVGAASLLLASAPVAAFNDGDRGPSDSNAAGAATGTTETPAAKPAKERKICRTDEADTGSRLEGRKICLTAEQWQKRRS
jgi:hypothetical protein